jgi:transcriptional regulator with XRE-family HTH domain
MAVLEVTYLPKRPLESLGALVRERRGARKLRETAAEIGIGAATLLRVEGGRIPDVATFGKICQWLGLDPGAFLGSEEGSRSKGAPQGPGKRLLVSAHMKVDQTPQPKTIKALAQMILLGANAQRDDEGR